MYMHWMDLELCTGDGCKTWPTKGLVHRLISLPEFLICEAKTVRRSKLFLFFCHANFIVHLCDCLIFEIVKCFMQFLTVSHSICRISCQARTVCLRWMDLELCTGDGCKIWPKKGLVHPTKSLCVRQRPVLHFQFVFVVSFQQHIKNVFRNQDCLHVHVLNGSWALYRRWV